MLYKLITVLKAFPCCKGGHWACCVYIEVECNEVPDMEVCDVLTTNYLMRKCAGVPTHVVKPRDPISLEVSPGRDIITWIITWLHLDIIASFSCHKMSSLSQRPWSTRLVLQSEPLQGRRRSLGPLGSWPRGRVRVLCSDVFRDWGRTVSVLSMSVPCRCMRKWLGIASLPSRSAARLRIFRDIAQSPGSFIQFVHLSEGGTPLRCSFWSRPADGGLSWTGLWTEGLSH